MGFQEVTYTFQPINTWASSNTVTYTGYAYQADLPPKPPTVIDWLRERVTEITDLAWAAA